MLFILLFVASHSFAANQKTEPARSSTRLIMDGIFNPLIQVLPSSFSSEEFSKNYKANLKNLKQLSDNAKLLVRHGAYKEKSFSFFARAFENDARQIYRLYERKNFSEARYLIQNVTENCISCHSKLPEGNHAPDLKDFFKNTQLQSLSLPEKATLLTALRQFDEALQTYEKFFNQTQKTTDLIRSDSLIEYLKVSLRVKNDATRPIPILKELSSRKDLPKFLQKELSAWIGSLESLNKKTVETGAELKEAIAIIQNSQKMMDHPMDRSGSVDFIYASGLLSRFVNETNHKKEELAEAYYWLGVTESLIGRSQWFSQTEFYLISSIRSAPKASVAKEAYRLLEQYYIMQYVGSSGLNVPEEIRQELDEMRVLIFE